MLTGSDSGTVWGTVIMNGADDTAYATLSFRQDVDSSEMIEIKSINVLSPYEYSVGLSEGPYTLVASTLFGYKTEKYSPLNVVAETPIYLDVEFLTSN
jgi:hypothetical protein